MAEGHPHPDDLEDRLVRFLISEHRWSRRTMALVHELPVDERVAKGLCLTDLEVVDTRGPKVSLRFPPQPSKVREGDWMVLGRGKPLGPEISRGVQVVVERIDSQAGVLTVELLETWEVPPRGGRWTLDYLSSDTVTPRLITSLRDAMRGNEFLRQLLAGRLSRTWEPSVPPGVLDPSQARAAREALGSALTLVHGPPGTGKTKVLVSVIRAMVAEGKTVLVSAYTHRAIDHLLHGLLTSDPNVACLKLGRRSPDLDSRIPSSRNPRTLERSPVVGATVHAVSRLPRDKTFHAVVIDEAGQLPLAHGAVVMSKATQAVVLAGDHFQLPPVLTASHLDPVASSSVFAYLVSLYPHRCFMLDQSYRLPPGLCEFPSKAFYQGRLRSAREGDGVILTVPPNPSYPEFVPLWRMSHPLRAVWVNHRGWGAFSLPEAELVARLVAALVQDLGLPASQVAVLAPHRAMVRQIADCVWGRLGPSGGSGLVVDTVERMQGQERDVVVLSLTSSDPRFIMEESEFLLSPHRLNVSLTRARRLLVVVGSRAFFRVYPTSPRFLESAWLFRQLEQTLLPHSVDLTQEAHAWAGLPPP